MNLALTAKKMADIANFAVWGNPVSRPAWHLLTGSITAGTAGTGAADLPGQGSHFRGSDGSFSAAGCQNIWITIDATASREMPMIM